MFYIYNYSIMIRFIYKTIFYSEGKFNLFCRYNLVS